MWGPKNLAARPYIGDQCQAEIGEEGAPLPVEQDVGRFDITVDYAFLVSIIQSGTHLSNNATRVIGLHKFLVGAITSQNASQVRAFHMLHRHVEPIILLIETIQPHDVGMIKPRDCLSLAFKPQNVIWIVMEGRIYDFDDRTPLETHIRGAIDARHTALREERFETVFAELLSDQGIFA